MDLNISVKNPYLTYIFQALFSLRLRIRYMISTELRACIVHKACRKGMDFFLSWFSIVPPCSRQSWFMYFSSLQIFRKKYDAFSGFSSKKYCWSLIVEKIRLLLDHHSAIIRFPVLSLRDRYRAEYFSLIHASDAISWKLAKYGLNVLRWFFHKSNSSSPNGSNACLSNYMDLWTESMYTEFLLFVFIAVLIISVAANMPFDQANPLRFIESYTWCMTNQSTFYMHWRTAFVKIHKSLVSFRNSQGTNFSIYN